MREKKRLYALMLIVLLTAIPTSVLAQKYSVNYQNQTIEQVLADLKKRTGYEFMYQKQTVSRVKPITCSYKDVTLTQLLDRIIYQGANIDYEVTGKTIILRPMTKQKDARPISGQVSDMDTGEPIIGATVKVVGTNVATITDVNGRFTLNHPYKGAEVTVSYVGMTSETLKATPDMNIRLHADLTVLNDVVVTGYQNIKKEKLVGSVTTVRAAELDERYTTNLLDNLEGRVAGLTTYDGKTTIRGVGSLYAETTPLLVVDGLPIEGTIDDINPYDVESVNVLKDAAAAAIYGARAANGIIVITTKSAKKKDKIDIDFSANLTIKEKRNFDYADNFYMTPEEQVNAESSYWDYYYFNNDGEVAAPIASTQSTLKGGSSDLTPIQWAYYQKALGNITDEELQSTLNQLKQNNYAKEWGKAISRQQVLQQYNLAVRSRSDIAQNNFTINYKHDNSGQINSYETLMNLTYKGVFDIAKWLTATVGVNAVYARSKGPGYDYNASYTDPFALAAYRPFYNSDGSVAKQYYWYSGNAYDSSVIPDGFYDMGVNPVDEYYNNTEETRRQHMRYQGALLFRIIEGLTVNAQFVYENSHTTTEWKANADSHAARTLRNAYTTLNADGTVTYGTPENGGFMNTTNTDGQYWTARVQADYNRTFGRHGIQALAGLEFRETKTWGSKALILGWDDQLQNSQTHTVDLGTLSQINYNNSLFSSSYGYPSYQFAFEPYIEESMGLVTEVLHRYASGYMNATYTYDEKYNVFGTFRKDYADVYGLNAKFRGKPLWSVGVGWNIHNESFMDNVKWVNFLKPRVSYGVTGNIYQGATSYMTATSTDSNYYTNRPMGTVESPANPNLKWEQTRTTNIGVDFSLLNNRLSGSLDYYNKVSKDVFSDRTLDPTTGYSSMFVNAASMRNRGVELQLTYQWKQARNRKDFGWTTSFTFSHNKNIVTDVENPATLAYELIDNPYVKGYPASALWSWQFAGISDQEGEQGQTLWYDADGNAVHSAQSTDVSAMVYSGQTDPKVVMGMDNRFTWNGFSLSILMAYYGGHVMRALAQDETFSTSWDMAIASYFNNAWTPENPTSTPGIGRYASTSLGYEPSYSDISVHPADFLKIRNIVFGYDLPQQWLRKLKLNRVSLRFQIDNPKYLWVKNDLGVDPETLGIRKLSSYIFGLNINF